MKPSSPSLFSPRIILENKIVAWECILDSDDDQVLVTNLTDSDISLTENTKLGFLKAEQPHVHLIHPELYEDFVAKIIEAPASDKKKKARKLIIDFEIGSHWNASETSQVNEVLQRNQDVFDEPGDPLRVTKVLKVRLPLKDSSKVVYQHNYNLSPAQDLAATKVVHQMLKEEILERAPHSNYRIPFMLVEKGRDKETQEMQYRMVLSAKKLNECLAKVNYSPPKIPHILSCLKGKDLFSVIDLSSSFHQLEIDERDRHILTIQHKGETFRYCRLPQGLSISSQYLCYALTLALGDLLYKVANSYVDDTIVYSKGGLEAHLVALERVFEAFRNANFGLNKKKCKFAFTKISFLGYLVDGEQYSPDPSRFRELEKLKGATTHKQAKSIYHYFSYYRIFLKNFNELSRPILAASDPTTPFKWDAEQEKAVATLHEALVKNTSLLYFDPERPTIICCDGSPVNGVGAILYQKCPKSKKYKPVSIFSRQFPKSERKMSPHDAELLALYYTLQRWRMELHAVQTFTLYTDCSAMVHLDAVKEPSQRQAKVQLYLTQFYGKYKIKHRKGCQQVCADFHSRTPSDMQNYNPQEECDAWAMQEDTLYRPDIFQKELPKSIDVTITEDKSSKTYQILEEMKKDAMAVQHELQAQEEIATSGPEKQREQKLRDPLLFQRTPLSHKGYQLCPGM